VRRRLTPATPHETSQANTRPAGFQRGENFGGPFAATRGKLPWPVDGRLLARFGESRGDDARAKWDGVMISAAAGSQVHAVHGGRVVFADWLRGAGLLVILDHGNGYLSLYGHNQTLLKSAGDVVKAGESISTVGNSGGQDTPALYFAIRQQGHPSDPAQWCRARIGASPFRSSFDMLHLSRLTSLALTIALVIGAPLAFAASRPRRSASHRRDRQGTVAAGRAAHLCRGHGPDQGRLCRAGRRQDPAGKRHQGHAQQP
jgi:hypothetical protein